MLVLKKIELCTLSRDTVSPLTFWKSLKMNVDLLKLLLDFESMRATSDFLVNGILLFIFKLGKFLLFLIF